MLPQEQEQAPLDRKRKEPPAPEEEVVDLTAAEEAAGAGDGRGGGWCVRPSGVRGPGGGRLLRRGGPGLPARLLGGGRGGRCGAGLRVAPGEFGQFAQGQQAGGRFAGEGAQLGDEFGRRDLGAAEITLPGGLAGGGAGGQPGEAQPGGGAQAGQFAGEVGAFQGEFAAHRRSASQVCGPMIPSTTRPSLSWSRLTARSVAGP